MLRVFTCLLLLLAAATGVRAADAEFVRVWPQWRDTESFQRIGEFFGGEEDTGRQVALRTHPETRDGFYFLVRVNHPMSLAGARVAVHVIRPDAPDVRTFVFPLAASRAETSGETVFQFGLTGADWPGGKSAQPVAWKLELLSADNQLLAAKKSFLWEKP